jgi:hypothetical protein
VIGVGNFIAARRSNKAWAPSEKAPLRHIPDNAILGAPPRVQVVQDLERFFVVLASLECIPRFRIFSPLDRALVCSWVYFPWQK